MHQNRHMGWRVRRPSGSLRRTILQDVSVWDGRIRRRIRKITVASGKTVLHSQTLLKRVDKEENASEKKRTRRKKRRTRQRRKGTRPCIKATFKTRRDERRRVQKIWTSPSRRKKNRTNRKRRTSPLRQEKRRMNR